MLPFNHSIPPLIITPNDYIVSQEYNSYFQNDEKQQQNLPYVL